MSAPQQVPAWPGHVDQVARLQQSMIALCAVVQELCVRIEKLEQQQQEEETDG